MRPTLRKNATPAEAMAFHQYLVNECDEILAELRKPAKQNYGFLAWIWRGMTGKGWDVVKA